MCEIEQKNYLVMMRTEQKSKILHNNIFLLFLLLLSELCKHLHCHAVFVALHVTQGIIHVRLSILSTWRLEAMLNRNIIE